MYYRAFAYSLVKFIPPDTLPLEQVIYTEFGYKLMSPFIYGFMSYIVCVSCWVIYPNKLSILFTCLYYNVSSFSNLIVMQN